MDEDHISDQRLPQLNTAMTAGDAYYDILTALRELQDRRRQEQGNDRQRDPFPDINSEFSLFNPSNTGRVSTNFQ